MAGLYDLMLLLDPNVPEERRSAVLQETESTISSSGELVSSQEWGSRRLAFEIDHRPEADYHLVQFRSEPELLERLRHSLKIADGVLRFRIIRQRTGAEAPPPSRPEGTAAEGEGGEGRVAARAAADAPPV